MTAKSSFLKLFWIAFIAVPAMAHELDHFGGRFVYPGEPVPADAMRVILMGTSPEVRPAQAACSVYVELGNGQSFIFDMGAGSFANYTAMGVAPATMNKVFLTHLHVDHFSDLIYFYGMSGGLGRTMPLEVWGPAGATPELGTRAAMDAMQAMTAWHRKTFSVMPVGNAYKLIVHEFDSHKNPGIVYDEDGVVIKSFPAIHVMTGPVSYRLEWNGYSVVYSGDTAPSKFMIKNGAGADLLIHEVRAPVFSKTAMTAFGDKAAGEKHNSDFNTAVHSDVLAVGKLFSLTRPKLGVLNHVAINPDTRVFLLDQVRKNYDGPVAIAEDLMVFDISKDGVKQKMGVAPSRPLLGNPPVPKDTPPAPESIDDLLPGWLRDAEFTDY